VAEVAGGVGKDGNWKCCGGHARAHCLAGCRRIQGENDWRVFGLPAGRSGDDGHAWRIRQNGRSS
jgi:hypothetical protein